MRTDDALWAKYIFNEHIWCYVELNPCFQKIDKAKRFLILHRGIVLFYLVP